ncbi:MAG: DUF4097 family beta strand repeat-containing protein [Actinomycetota bacterium]|nr:DUF4097 family beta strand repeat-containing protein [Actinomycetota bacterium]
MQSFLTPDPIVVEVRNAAGTVTIDLTDTTTTTVDVVQLSSNGLNFIDDLMSSFRRDTSRTENATDVLDDVRVDLRVQENGTVLIVDADPARSGWRASFGVHITAPAGSGIRTQTQSADVRVTGSADRLDIRTAAGDVQADRVERGSLVQSASGDVRISEIGGDAEIRSVSGDVTVQRCAGAISVHSTSGDVRIEQPEQDVFVRSVSGDINLRDAVTGSIQATAVSGDIEIGIHAGSAAKLDLSTVAGDTRNDFELSDEPLAPSSQDTPVDDADVKRGGRLEITCRTTSGDIRLRRAVAA